MTNNQKILIQSDASFFLSNNTKTCTISRLIKGIQLLACNLGAEFAMLCSIYYLLFDCEMFSVFLFLEEVTVCKMDLTTFVGFCLPYSQKIDLIVIFKCATDDFQKSWKNVIFEHCVKNLLFVKVQMFDDF